jgi:hypothetical protein
MSQRDRIDKPPVSAPAPLTPSRRSGRAKVDDRGRDVEAWSAKTGMFDRYGSTQRIRALTESVKLEIEDSSSNNGSRAFNPYDRAPDKSGSPGFNPYDRAPGKRDLGAFNPYARAPDKPKPRASEPGSGDPYSSGPARRPEDISFNPFDRRPHKP